jgi:hypothetical protein
MAFPSSPLNGLVSLTEKIHGFTGYENSSSRKPSDRQLRKFLVTGIETILTKLEALPPAAIEEDQRLLAEAVQSTRRKLSTISASLQDPTYAGQDFFTRDQLSEKRLARIYYHENDMLEELDGIQSEVVSLQNNHIEKEMIDDHFLHISDFIDNLNQALFERESLILGNQ